MQGEHHFRNYSIRSKFTSKLPKKQSPKHGKVLIAGRSTREAIASEFAFEESDGEEYFDGRNASGSNVEVLNQNSSFSSNTEDNLPNACKSTSSVGRPPKATTYLINSSE